jgi:iron(III) transport system substrate-binding protein
MKKIFRVLLIILVFLSFLVGVSFADIKVFHGYPPSVEKVVYPFIKQKTGITVVGSIINTNILNARMKLEGENFDADMLLECSTDMSKLAKENSWSIPYFSPTWKDINPVLYDKDGYYYTTFRTISQVVGNKPRLKKLGYNMPTSWKDLLDPKWKGEILLANPLTGEMASFTVGFFLQVFGEKKGWEYMENLDKNIHHYTRRTSDNAAMVANGEFLLGVTSARVANSFLSEGYPIATVVLKEGMPYQDFDVIILKGTKNLPECKKVLDFMGTVEFDNFMRQLGEGTTRSLDKIKVFPMDFDKIRRDMKDNNEIWKQKFNR